MPWYGKKRSAADIVVYCKYDTKDFPITIFELGAGTISEKRAQLAAYAWNFFGKQMPKKHVWLMLGVILLPSSDWEVRAYYFTHPIQERREGDDPMSDVLIGAGSRDTLNRLWNCLSHYFDKIKALQQDSSSPFLETAHLRKRNTLIQGERVFKTYDYRSRSPVIDVSEQRNHSLYDQYMEDVKVEAQSNDFVLISYKHVKGSHIASNGSQFQGVYETVKKMHTAGHCHGDVRAANIVFTDSSSVLIDFDYSGATGEQHYPRGYNVDIPDGKRHADAASGQKLVPCHDVFSLAAVMNMYTATEKANDSAWKNTIGRVSNSDADDIDWTALGGVDIQLSDAAVSNILDSKYAR
jgi:hypothetical protein